MIGSTAHTRRIVGAIIKRPFRLLGLAIASLLAGAVIWSSGGFFHRELGELAGSGEWLNLFWVGEFDWSTFWQALLRGKAGSEYNPPLWTIKIEVIGSFLVFFTLLAINWLPRIAQFVALLGLLVVTLGTYYDVFAIGMLFVLLDRPANASSPTGPRKPGAAMMTLLVLLIVLLAGYPFYAAPSLLPGWSAVTGSISMAGAAIVFLIVHRTVQCQAWLSHPALIRLGELSYAIYVVHFLLMGSLTAWLVLVMTPATRYGAATLIAAVVSLPCLFLLSAPATRWIDQPSIHAGRQVEQLAFRLLPQRAVSGATAPPGHCSSGCC